MRTAGRGAERLLRRFIVEAVSMGPAYARMEAIRQRLQDIIEINVRDGAIVDQARLADWWDGVDADVKRLRGVQVEFLVSNPGRAAAGASSKEFGDMIHDAALGVETPSDMTSWLNGVDMSMRALRAVPLEVWRRKVGASG